MVKHCEATCIGSFRMTSEILPLVQGIKTVSPGFEKKNGVNK